LSDTSNWILARVRRLFQSEESRFVLGTAIKFCGMTLLVMGVLGSQVYGRARLNFYFFSSFGDSHMADLRDAYFDYVMSSFVEALPVVLAYVIAVFFLGVWIAKMILRPFKNIGSYCQHALEDPNTHYVVEAFAGHRLLTRFSELFFDSLTEARAQGRLTPRSVPPQFMGVHKPVLDGLFLLHYGLFMLILMITSTIAIMYVVTEIHENTIQLAIRMLKTDPRVTSSFFMAQQGSINEMWLLAGSLVWTLYGVLAFHLYHQVSGAAFGIFATMRTFMKGNYAARVHLVGYAFLRESTRSLNKYLEWAQKNLSK